MNYPPPSYSEISEPNKHPGQPPYPTAPSAPASTIAYPTAPAAYAAGYQYGGLPPQSSTAPLNPSYGGQTNPGYATAYPQNPSGPPGPSPLLVGQMGRGIAAEQPQTEETGSVESNQWNNSSFSDKRIRQAFIRKVYLILMTQLAFTFAIVCVFCFVQPIKTWLRTGTNVACYYVSYAVFVVTYIILICVPSVRRKVPGNYICLAIFTIALTYMTATISSYHDTYIVLVAIGITAAVCLAISLFAIQTKIDFTRCGGVLFALSMVVFFFGLSVFICFLVTRDRFTLYVMNCVYGGLAALLFSLFLAYDTQMLIGGRKYQLSEEEYITGALQLYLDVVYLFIIILGLFGGGSK